MRNGEDWSAETEREAERALCYTFRDKRLLRAAFTHKSYANARGGEHNERLEFLGDAVLQLCVTERLYRECGEDEGTLTEDRKNYVSQTALTQAEARAGLMRFLRHSGGGENVGGKTSSNLFEAAVGAVYLDGGYEAAEAFVFRFVFKTEDDNFKTKLQELAQERGGSLPYYETAKGERENFRCVVSALGERAQGEGRSKQAAENAAAKALYGTLIKRTGK